MSYARVKGGKVIEVISFDPAGRYPADWEWIDAPDGTVVGADYDGTAFSNPVVPEPPAPPTHRTTISQVDYFGLFTPEEEAEINLIASQEVTKAQVDAADAATKPQLRAVLYLQVMLARINKLGPHDLIEMDNPQVLAGLDLLVQMGLITAERRVEIARGVPIEAQ